MPLDQDVAMRYPRQGHKQIGSALLVGRPLAVELLGRFVQDASLVGSGRGREEVEGCPSSDLLRLGCLHHRTCELA